MRRVRGTRGRTALVLPGAAALAGCMSLEPARESCVDGPVRVGGDARQGVVHDERTGTRFDSRIRIALGVGACT